MSTETRLQALLQTTPAWLKTGGPIEDVVVSARVRLARNVADRAFPEQLADEDAEDILAATASASIHVIIHVVLHVILHVILLQYYM